MTFFLTLLWIDEISKSKSVLYIVSYVNSADIAYGGPNKKYVSYTNK